MGEGRRTTRAAAAAGGPGGGAAREEPATWGRVGAVAVLDRALRDWAGALPGVDRLLGWADGGAAEIASATETLRGRCRAAWQVLVRDQSLATHDEVLELRARLEVLEALVRQGVDDEGRPRTERLSPRLRESLGRASAALAGMTVKGSGRAGPSGTSDGG